MTQKSFLPAPRKITKGKMIKMDDIVTLTLFLVNVVEYILYGSIFCGIVRFILFSNQNTECKGRLISYLSVGFVLATIYSNIYERVASVPCPQKYMAPYIIVCSAVTALLAYGVSMLLSHTDIMNKVLLKLGINRTTNKSIWADVIKNNMVMNIHIKSENVMFVGYHLYTEENVAQPKIVLEKYKILNSETHEILIDHSKNSNQTIMIDTRDVSYIEIVYV